MCSYWIKPQRGRQFSLSKSDSMSKTLIDHDQRFPALTTRANVRQTEVALAGEGIVESDFMICSEVSRSARSLRTFAPQPLAEHVRKDRCQCGTRDSSRRRPAV